MIVKNFAVAGTLRPSGDGAHLFSVLRALQKVGIDVSTSDDLLELCRSARAAADEVDDVVLDVSSHVNDCALQVEALQSLLGADAPFSADFVSALLKCGGGNPDDARIVPRPFAFVLPFNSDEVAEDLASAFPVTFGDYSSRPSDAAEYESALVSVDDSSESVSYVDLPDDVGSVFALVTSPAVLAATTVKNILAAAPSHITLTFPAHGSSFETTTEFKYDSLAFVDYDSAETRTYALIGDLYEELTAIGDAYNCCPIGAYETGDGSLAIDFDLSAFFSPDIACAAMSEAPAVDLVNIVSNLAMSLVPGTAASDRIGVPVNLSANTSLLTSSVLTYLSCTDFSGEEEEVEEEEVEDDAVTTDLHCGDKGCDNSGCGGACSG